MPNRLRTPSREADLVDERENSRSSLAPRVAYENEVARARMWFVKLVTNSPEQRRNYEQRARVLRDVHSGHPVLDWATVAGTGHENGPDPFRS
jgi:hypothetical protein